MIPKYKKGQTVYYMYLNWICKFKVDKWQEKEGLIYYSDAFNEEILEKYVFKDKSALIDFHSISIKK